MTSQHIFWGGKKVPDFFGTFIHEKSKKKTSSKGEGGGVPTLLGGARPKKEEKRWGKKWGNKVLSICIQIGS